MATPHTATVLPQTSPTVTSARGVPGIGERGFQSGAIAAARQTSVTTVTFESLRSSSADELRTLKKQKIADQISDLLGRLDDVGIRRPFEYCRDIVTLEYPKGVEGDWLRGVRSWLLERRNSLDEAKRDRFPLRCTSFTGDNSLVPIARNMDEWLQFTEPGLQTAVRVVAHLETMAHS
ncbi:MAG: hypothetical protein ACRDQ4_06835 [Pseudonocardiaceae bacterium]